MRKTIVVLLVLCAKIAQAQIYIDSYRFAVAGPGIVTDNLIGHYDVGDPTSYPGTGTTIFDLTTPQENMSLSGATYNAGGYMNFDGLNDYGVLSGAAFNSFTTYTIEIICSIDGSANDFDGLILKQTRNSWDDGFGIYFNNNSLNTFVNNWATGPKTSYNIGTTEPLSQLIFTYDGSAIKIYQNGNEVASSPGSGNIINSVQSFHIFAWRNTDGSIGGFLGGKLYALRIYNDALSSSEVLQNYNATKTRYGY